MHINVKLQSNFVHTRINEFQNVFELYVSRITLECKKIHIFKFIKLIAAINCSNYLNAEINLML